MADFRNVQQQMVDFLRRPDEVAAPEGIEARRLKIYQDLIYNNIENFLSSGFPVFHSIISEEKWHYWVRRFIVEHRCHSPLFMDISYEFVQYLESLEPSELEFPFMLELAHYEWVELAVMASTEDEVAVGESELADSLTPKLSENVWLLAYSFPVHRISDDYIPEQPGEQPSLLMVYRDREDEVGFSQLTPATFRLAQLVELKHFTIESLISTLSKELNFDPIIIENEIKHYLDDWIKKGIIIELS